MVIHQLRERIDDRFRVKYGVFDINKDCFVDKKDDVFGPEGKPDGMITIDDWKAWQEKTRKKALDVTAEPKKK